MDTSLSMRLWRASTCALAICCVAALALPGVAAAAHTSRAPRRTPAAAQPVEARAAAALDAMPLYFEETAGRSMDTDARFTARGEGYGVALGPNGVAFALGAGRDAAPDVVRMRFAGAATPRMAGDGELGGKINRLRGSDASTWTQGIRTYSRVRYAGVYPGVDAVWYGNRRSLEYDFVVAPGADAAAIRLAFDGARSVAVAGDGSLVVKSARGEVRQKRPVAYQQTATGRKAVSCGYEVRGSEARLALGDYDRSLALVVDPVLEYATYLGAIDAYDAIRAIAVDAEGNMYVTGEASSPNFPTRNSIRPYASSWDIFITKINAAGTELVYSTFLGAANPDQGFSIAIDAAGNAFVAGRIDGPDFPVLNAIQPTAPELGGNAFVAKLGPTGELLFSTYLGGSEWDSAYGIALDPSGNPVVVGETVSRDFPTVRSLQAPSVREGRTDAFVTKLSADGQQMLFSTYLGGGFGDSAYGVAVDATGAAYVVGYAESRDFPTTAGSLKPVKSECSFDPGPTFDCWDAFVTKIGSDGSLVYSTFLGGGDSEAALAVAVDGSGNAYVVGWTASVDFPTVNPIQPATPNASQGFVTKLNPAGSALVYSTFLGGASSNGFGGVAVDGAGQAYVVGTASTDTFPTVNPVEGFIGDPHPGGVVAVLDSTGSSLLFATYYSGSDSSGIRGVALGADGALYVAGATSSSDLMLRNPLFGFPGADDGIANGFIAKFSGVTNYVTPPTVDRVKTKRKSARRARITLEGRNFQAGMRIFVGDSDSPWASVSQIGTTVAVLENAADLLRTLPKGSKAQIRCVNPDGGTYTAFVTMK